MNTSIKTKINRLGLVGQIIAILLIIGAVAALVCFIGDTISHLTPDPTITISESDGAIAYVESVSVSYSIGSVILPVMQFLAYAGAVASYIVLKKIADGFRRCDTPFEERIIRRMTVFAWMQIAISILSLLVTAMNVVPFMLSDGVSWSAVSVILYCVFPSFGLVVALFVLFLTKIFRYGAELQKQSDETL